MSRNTFFITRYSLGRIASERRKTQFSTRESGSCSAHFGWLLAAGWKRELVTFFFHVELQKKTDSTEGGVIITRLQRLTTVYNAAAEGILQTMWLMLVVYGSG